MGLPGPHPRLENVAGLNRTRPSTTMRTAGGLGTPGFCECGTCVTAIAPRWCTAVEVTDDARPQRPSPNDKPHDTCTETARDRENGTAMVPERDGDVRQWHVRR